MTSSSAPPPLSNDQRRLALTQALRARAARSQALQQLRDGDTDIETLLDLADRDRAVARIKVLDLVKTLPGVGPVGAQQLLDEIGIDGVRRLRGLGVRQRKSLIEVTAYPIRWRKGNQRNHIPDVDRKI